ncbi:N-acetylmuramoyl-L-alanine amidase [Actinomycetospora flava]|uniref:N-acetylmuramoyl-L-alanine amidase n=1 Tax=Actinomycetospora flava TaxID=3129232 RepID=A0ABU8M687_9PSEU
MTAKSGSRNGTKPFLIGIHTNEGPNPAGDEGRDQAAENLSRWMDGQDVSYHKIVDDDSAKHYVPDERYSWAMRSGNRRSLNLCFIGRASFSRDEWLRHDAMLRLGAAAVRGWCDRWGIPRTKLTAAQVGADHAGICGHVDWTNGKHDGTHTDPGAGFPWDVFLAYVNGGTPNDQFVARRRRALLLA